ncbi:hypothetical protein ANTPLA_LOCUS3414 [Anthophora plagiata]
MREATSRACTTSGSGQISLLLAGTVGLERERDRPTRNSSLFVRILLQRGSRITSRIFTGQWDERTTGSTKSAIYTVGTKTTTGI